MNKGTKILLLLMVFGFLFAGLWNKFPIIKDSIHFVLDPTAGALLDWNVNFGIIIIAAVISFCLTLIQKYTIDQDSLKELKKQQKNIREEMQKHKDNSEKLMELNKRNLEFAMKSMDLSTNSLLYSFLPILLFFRWFSDYFAVAGGETQIKIFGFLGWIWAYLIFSIFFSIIFRKVLKLS